MKKRTDGWQDEKKNNYINRFFQLIDSKATLFKSYLLTTPKRELDEWKENVDEPILFYYLRTFVDVIVIYGFAGLCLAFVSSSFALVPSFSLRYVVSYSILYWFLIQLLDKIFRK